MNTATMCDDNVCLVLSCQLAINNNHIYYCYLSPIIHSLIRDLIGDFVRPFVRSFIHSFIGGRIYN